jgi:hypothetical protein
MNNETATTSVGVTSGRALMKSAAGDSVVLQVPGGTEYLTVLEVSYEHISVEPFREHLDPRPHQRDSLADGKST